MNQNPSTSSADTSTRRNRRTARTASVLAGAILASAAIVIPSGVTEAAYNVGVKSVHLNNALETCTAGQALPCTPGAGTGDSNVLRVTQSKVNGHYQFNGLQTNTASNDHVWFSADIAAECRVSHSLALVFVDDDLTHTTLDGALSGLNSYGSGGADGPWPHIVPLPGQPKTLPSTRIAMNVPVSVVAGQQFGGAEGLYAYGETKIAERVAAGMTFAEARAVPFEFQSIVTLGVEARCFFNGLSANGYFKRRYRTLPLTVQYVPVEAGPAAGDGHLEPTGDLGYAAQVTDVNLVVLPDPADPCVLHLSGTIQTNQATPVQYRWVNPHGQRSNTYSIDVDLTQVAFVHGTVAIPQLEGPDFTDDLAVVEGPGQIGDYTNHEITNGLYSGTYKLEVLSPHFKSAAHGFNVEYCPGTTPTGQRTPTGESAVGVLTIGDPPPTHDEITIDLRS